jgi:hypothetical protein
MSAPHLICFPSTEEGNDFFAIAPAGMSIDEAIEKADEVIMAANIEDAANEEGGCDDGLTVEESIKRRLGEIGFVFPEIRSTIAWDDHYEQLAAPAAP